MTGNPETKNGLAWVLYIKIWKHGGEDFTDAGVPQQFFGFICEKLFEPFLNPMPSSVSRYLNKKMWSSMSKAAEKSSIPAEFQVFA